MNNYIKDKEIIITSEHNYRYKLSLNDHSIRVQYQEYQDSDSPVTVGDMNWVTQSSSSFTIDILPILCDSMLELGKFYADEKNYIFDENT